MNPWHPLPHEIYSFVERTPGTVLLHSSSTCASATSRLFTSPIKIIEVRELGEIPDLFTQIEEAIHRGHLAAGYFAYESGECFEPTATLRHRETDLLAWFGIYERCKSFNHTLGAFESELPHLPVQKHKTAQETQPDPTSIVFALNQHQFTERIGQIHNFIRAGDVYQLNFTFPLHARFAETLAALYGRLSAAQPVEYGAFLHTQTGRHILSFSPELFFRIDGERRITTQPMKGTAPRGRTTTEDREIAAWLVNDAKNRAENVMIVDLIRNDLGRLCTFGSIHVDQLFEVERYPSLWQMTSRISGHLEPDVNCEEIFRALFPCGSITGAPKVRAMQLLAQIEEEPRGVYTGAIGYFSRAETLFNVAIRTLELEDGRARMGVGGGIVIDSEPAAEYQECRLKAEFLTRSTEPFSLIETMLWNGTFPLLELHLDRLSDSADFFDFIHDRDTVRATLIAEAARFSDNRSRKVRLLLDATGTTHIHSEIIPNTEDLANPPRACIAAQRTDPADQFLFHKTTRRELYNRAFTAASSSGFADILFLNTRGEITEGAVHNVFIERSGRWYTPSLDCGVLPGVYRRHLLTTRPEIEEKILSINDLKAADSVYLSNAVRGLRRVTIDFHTAPGF
jgi:para-aminobenzoate synthetase / 4-amino-4-deoxychorismate lyase